MEPVRQDIHHSLITGVVENYLREMEAKGTDEDGHGAVSAVAEARISRRQRAAACSQRPMRTVAT